jgi:hypothetical protein
LVGQSRGHSRLLPLLWGNSTLRWYDYFQRDPTGPSWLEAVHGGRLYDTNPITTNDFSEALGGLVVFIYPKVNSWGPLVDETDCLKSSGSLVSLQPTSFSSGAGYCHFLRRLWCASLRSKKVRCYFAGPTRQKPRQER